MTWSKVMRGAYINGGYMIISESIAWVESFGYVIEGQPINDWCLFVGGDFMSSHETLREAKIFSEWI